MIKAIIFDLDGTLYRGKTVILGAVEKVAELRKAGKKVFFLTNAATKSRTDVAAKLSGMGFDARKEEVVCGAYLLARYIAQNHRGKKVFVVGERGIFDEFMEAGVATTAGEDADVVAVGLDRTFTYDKLCRAHINLRKGALFLASNNDHVYPTEQGDLPGAGSIVAAIEFASGKKPHIIGKPNPYALELLMKENRLKCDEVLMVGDRPDIDIAFAKNCGIKSALVLTGTTKKEEMEKKGKDGRKPDYVLASVADLKI